MILDIHAGSGSFWHLETFTSRPKSNLGMKRLPSLFYRGLQGNLNPKQEERQRGIRAYLGSKNLAHLAAHSAKRPWRPNTACFPAGARQLPLMRRLGAGLGGCSRLRAYRASRAYRVYRVYGVYGVYRV